MRTWNNRIISHEKLQLSSKMDPQYRSDLEPIQEESEQTEELKESTTAEGDEEDSLIRAVVEAEEVTAEDQTENDDDGNILRLLRPRRLSRSLSKESFPRMQSTNNQQEGQENSSVSESHHEASQPKQARVGSVKSSTSGELRITISKIRFPPKIPAKPSVQRKTSRKRAKKARLVEEPFPEWLVDLMFNIEEATTHQLVVE